MNNQAAQTMPERTYMTRDEALKIARACAYAKCHTHGYLPRTAQEAADWQPHEWVLDAIRWNALSQTAGVPREPTREHIEAFKRAEIKCIADYSDEMSPEYRGLEAVFAMLAAAPAASTKYCSDERPCTPCFSDNGTCEDAPAASGGEDEPVIASDDFNRGWKAGYGYRDKAEPQPPSAASVSERARAMPESLRTEIFNAFDDITGLCRHLREGGPVDDDLNGLNEGLQEAIHIAGGMMARMSEPMCEPSPDDVKRRARELLAEAERGPQNDYGTVHRQIAHRALEQALTQQRGCATCGGRGEIGGHVGQTAETFDYVTEPCPECTTPQPGAEALRELVQRWRFMSDPYHGKCADELESLLGRGGA